VTLLHNRRQLLSLLLGSALLPISCAAQPSRHGHLVIIGGAEDRQQDRVILRRFLSLSGGNNARIKFITAASGFPDASWASYQAVFADLGATDCELVPLLTRDDASNPEVIRQLAEADGIFMTGGDQNRLMECLWESPAAKAMHRAFHLKGACIAGTSAGAAVMSRQMLAQGSVKPNPEKDLVQMDIGLGFIANAIIDQHFSQRQRLSRLLSALAQRPDLLGVGIDEDTALVIERGQSIEVVGRGAVTLVDPRKMQSNFDLISSEEKLEMLGLQLHLLPAGHRYVVPSTLKNNKKQPTALWEALYLLAQTGPMRD
jgi:cyanophycinase